MEAGSIELRPIMFPTLQPCDSDELLALYRAAVEWSLDDPIIINARDDLISEQKWKDLVDPYHHQVTNLLTFCRRLPVTLLADDVGLGKTISAGLVASELMSRKRVQAILIVCPKILAHQWKEELETKFRINSEIAIGSELIKLKPNEKVSAIITTYNSARIHLSKLPEDRFQMLILDEAHKLRNLFGSDQPPQVAIEFNRVLENRFFKYVLMLTATPLQNRLWDLYSIIHLLATAKGHENPFGSEGQFKRKYILDDESKARRLRPEAKDQFQSIIYSYMSRIRRNDSNLSFPSRKIFKHEVRPRQTEKELLEYLSSQIQTFNTLTQIGILKAFTSSPHAVQSFCNSLARNQTASEEFASNVRAIVAKIDVFSKLDSLANLVQQIRTSKPDAWRVVVFTTSRETQTSIEAHLSSSGVRCGIINGTTGARNPETLRRFRADPPELSVIISTEAGAEGVNLQAANVLINFDLPWNPMVVEQRIGRIQRLGSKHESVAIYNLVLAGTFDEFIVGRLIEKLQLASHAVGDIEALLETSGLGEGEDSGEGVEEQIRKLVLLSLKGQNFAAAVVQAEASIDTAKKMLSEQEATINTLLGDMDATGTMGPKPPTFPLLNRSMDAREFAKAGLRGLGAVFQSEDDFRATFTLDGRTSKAAFEGAPDEFADGHINYRVGGTAFARLTQRFSKPALHQVHVKQRGKITNVKVTLEAWAQSFHGQLVGSVPKACELAFEGQAHVRAKAFVAHDSFETIVVVECQSAEHRALSKAATFENRIFGTGEEFGLNLSHLEKAVLADPGIVEFCRFYLERREDELKAAQGNERKAKKLFDEFTPRIESSVVSAEGITDIEQEFEVAFKVAESREFKTTIRLGASGEELTDVPSMATCEISFQVLPELCLDECDFSKKKCFVELLVVSEFSGQKMLPEFAVTCEVSGKVAARAETELSSATGKIVHRSLLRTSALSGQKAEIEQCAVCEFTNTTVLKSETVRSDKSGRLLRVDRAAKSSISGRTADQSEIVVCRFSDRSFLSGEGEKCGVTSEEVAPGVLLSCELSGLAVLPTELLKCVSTGKIALARYFVKSSVSGTNLLQTAAIQSIEGHYCEPSESDYCFWSNSFWHPIDVGRCSITHCGIHNDYLRGSPTELGEFRQFVSLDSFAQEASEIWPIATFALQRALDGKSCTIKCSKLSPGGKTLALKAVVKTLFGLKRREVAFLLSTEDNQIKGTLHWAGD
jgi:superfamily II DNA or RNA helicase